MDSQFLSWTLVFVLGILVGRYSLRWHLRELETRVREADSNARAQSNELASLIDEYNELVDLYNDVVEPKGKRRMSEGKSSERSAIDVAKLEIAKTVPAEPVAAVPEPASVSFSEPRIVTRTNTLPVGLRALDDWVEKSDWLETEDRTLKSLINSGLTVSSIALALGIDQKDVAYRATRLFFDEWGELDDKSKAQFDGTTWTAKQKSLFDALLSSGKSLSELSRRLGRTKIAIGWRMIDNRKMHF